MVAFSHSSSVRLVTRAMPACRTERVVDVLGAQRAVVLIEEARRGAQELQAAPQYRGLRRRVVEVAQERQQAEPVVLVGDEDLRGTRSMRSSLSRPAGVSSSMCRGAAITPPPAP